MKNKNNNHLRKVGSQDEENKKERLSIASCRKILKGEEDEFTDEDLLTIRDYFYCLAAVTMEQYQNEKAGEATIINLEHYKTTTDEESHYLRAG